MQHMLGAGRGIRMSLDAICYCFRHEVTPYETHVKAATLLLSNPEARPMSANAACTAHPSSELDVGDYPADIPNVAPRTLDGRDYLPRSLEEPRAMPVSRLYIW